MKRCVFSFGFCVSLTLGSMAAAHTDVLITRDGDRIVTGGYDFDASPGEEVVAPPVREFGYDFGEVPGQPHFAEDPGLVAPAGIFPAGTSFSFSLLDDLKFWDGAGFGPVPGGESLLIEKGSLSVMLGTGESLPKPGFTFGTASGALTGLQLHEHLEITLLGSNGDFTPPAADGIYLLSMLLHGTGGLEDSEPFWLVYNHGVDEEDHDLAIDWVQQNLVPEPGALMLLGFGLWPPLIRRRRPQCGSSAPPERFTAQPGCTGVAEGAGATA